MTMMSTDRSVQSISAQATQSVMSVMEVKPDAAALASPGAAWGVNPSERKLKMINLVAVLVPVIGLFAAIGLLWGIAFDWVQLAIMGLMYLVTAIGITVGFHRMATHKSFRAPAAVRYLLAAAGSMAAQGPVIRWCGEHRKHHQHSDTEEDPHSPHMSANGSWGEGVWATVKGAWHAHIGWLLRAPGEGLAKYTVDLRKDKVLVAASKQFPWLVLAGLIIPAVLGGLITMTWSGALLGFLWGGLVRVLMVHHITWSVNSVCHLWGSKPFESHDESRNNAVVGILAMGEGWHNNHHAFPTSARHGLRWWELDVSYAFIRVLGLLGLAKEIRVPDAERVASKRR
ncbi:MAG TPA: fatty acid desaturase [Phycisphaerales bacterium]|nr:fatty acid desaturase [Phycisphaerales bacterium]